MPRPKTKTDLIEASESKFDDLMAMIASLDEEIILKGDVIESWSIKDILAHLHAWHKMYLQWYQVGMTGEKPEMPAPGYTWTTTPALNAEIYERYKDVPLEEILSALRGSHQAVMEIIKSHSDEELFTKKRYKWTGTTSVGAYTVSATSSHYDWAIKHIKKYLKAIG